MAEGSQRGVAAPQAVWAQVREDYLAGRSASECCRIHGVGLTALRGRAAREGWRRADQPWTPPTRLDPWDEGVALEERIGGDLDRVEFGSLAFVAHRRMMRAVLRGDAMEALRWRRVRLMIDAEAAEIAELTARDEAEAWHREQEALREAMQANRSDGSDGSDGVFADRAPDGRG
ncbi:hypothetical protein [Brevundimonas subvibrioides]|uniref:Terminase small subunit n=1 Tax=Brevundimonas subvibrioides (strain ATCC 15264 / DSM 4735 / LMG 14903 / NBRC 16000 / CB 81) TaxID=633149 RepID=D9QN60_BRESC|nr:hypothetical protein [Brevundimonas subvibrioides]ADL00261.1 hypothetical protein Bresu_0948 [Brevundimonas subvibrioides ATCC 15264]